MHTYLALLRGINVSGQKIIKMENLRNLMVNTGFENVQTYIQSGNVIFDYAQTTKAELVQKMNEMIRDEYGFDVGIIILDYNELDAAITNNPFINDAVDLKTLYIVFLSDNPSSEAVEKWQPEVFLPDLAIIEDKVIYLKYFVSAGTSKLTNPLIESKLKVIATTRNWNTTIKLRQLLKERRDQ